VYQNNVELSSNANGSFLMFISNANFGSHSFVINMGVAIRAETDFVLATIFASI